MSKYKWRNTERTLDLTITIFARNLVDLHYPFVESFISTLPLGCHYLVGDCSTDNTRQVYEELAKYAPIDFVDFDWPLDREPGWGAVAIGICTQRTIEKSSTEFVLNVQACEVYCNDALEQTLALDPVESREYMFNHFYGSMHHGGPGYGGYPHAPRLCRYDTKFDRTDAWVPNNYNGGYPKLPGYINRYGHCFINTINNKMYNKVPLYFEDATPVEPKIYGLMEMRKIRTWTGPHPDCVHHLLELDNYDVNQSLDYAKKHLLR